MQLATSCSEEATGTFETTYGQATPFWGSSFTINGSITQFLSLTGSFAIAGRFLSSRSLAGKASVDISDDPKCKGVDTWKAARVETAFDGDWIGQISPKRQVKLSIKYGEIIAVRVDWSLPDDSCSQPDEPDYKTEVSNSRIELTGNAFKMTLPQNITIPEKINIPEGISAETTAIAVPQDAELKITGSFSGAELAGELQVRAIGASPCTVPTIEKWKAIRQKEGN